MPLALPALFSNCGMTLQTYIIYYSFDLFDGSGIADQLGAQFAHIYSLGRACGWHFVSLKPVRFARQVASNGLLSTRDKEGLSQVSAFLGLEAIDPHPPFKHRIDVALKSLINGVSSVQDINNRVESLTSSCSGDSKSDSSPCPAILVKIILDNDYHSLIPAIQGLTGLGWAKTLQLAGMTYLRDRSGIPHSNVITDNPLTVAHIRIGDSVRIDTPYCPVILHGDKIFTSITTYWNEIGAIDKSRVGKSLFRPYDFSALIASHLEAKGYHVSSLFLVSDGFSGARASLCRHITSRRLGACRTFRQAQLPFPPLLVGSSERCSQPWA
jgi:hypothetical protein